MSVNKITKSEKKRFSFRMAKDSDLYIHLSMIGLMLFGTAMIGSASMGLVGDDQFYLLKTEIKQFVFLLVGYYFMAQLSNRFSLKFLKGSSFPTMIILMEGALLSCLAFTEAGGAHAWIRIPIPGMAISIQPSEFTKIMSILIVAAYTGDINKNYKKASSLWGRPLIFLLIYIITIAVIQSDFGSAAVIFIISCVCLLIPHHNKMYGLQLFLRIAFWITVFAAVFILSPFGEEVISTLPLKTYQKSRFLAAINPFADRYGDGYQLINGLIAFASGGLFGIGFGKSVTKYTYFPAANTDFILAILVEELGIVGFCVLMLLYGVIIFRLLYYARKMKSERARIILVGTAMYMIIHIFFNIGGVTGLIPLTGVPLLMISSGGSSTMSIMACVGISQAMIASYRRGDIR